MRIVSVKDLKVFLEIPTSDYDELLTMVVGFVSSRIQTFLNRELKKQSRTIYRDAGRKRYFLPAYPIDTSETLTVTYDGTVQTVDDDYYVWSDEGIIEFDTETSYVDPKEVVIVWTGGYIEYGTGLALYLDVHEDIRFATILQSAFVFRRRKDIGISSMTMPDGSLSMAQTLKLLPEVKELLKPHRRTPGEY